MYAAYVCVFLPLSSVITEPLPPPDPPTQLTALEITSTSFAITWRPSQGDVGNGDTMYYVINVTEMEGRGLMLQNKVNSGISVFRVPDLHPDYVYQVTVAAVLEERVSPSVTLFVKTSPVTRTYLHKHTFSGYFIV